MSNPTSLPRHIVLIAALGKNRVIGRNGELPWRLPDDLRRFKALTTGGVVIMGRKTFESIGRALPNRRNFVVSRNPRYAAIGCEVFTSLDAAFAAAGTDTVFVIGGGELYRLALPRATRLELTLVDAAPAGDATFPEYNPADWWEVSTDKHRADALHPQSFTFVTLRRKD